MYNAVSCVNQTTSGNIMHFVKLTARWRETPVSDTQDSALLSHITGPQFDRKQANERIMCM